MINKTKFRLRSMKRIIMFIFILTTFLSLMEYMLLELLFLLLVMLLQVVMLILMRENLSF